MIRSLPIFIGLRYFASGGRNSVLASFISMLALSGLALGVGLLIIVLSVMNGFDREMRERILSVVPHIQIINPKAVGDWRAHRDLIARSEQVTEVTPFNQVDGLLFSQNQTRPIQILGLSPEAVPAGLNAVLSESGLKIPTAGGMLLAEPLAEALNLSVGKTINIVLPSDSSRQAGVFSFKLAGVFSTHTEVDQILGIAALGQVGQMSANKGRVDGFRVQVEDEFNARLIARQLLGKLPFGYGFRDWLQTHGNLYQAIQLSRNLVALLIFLIVGIAAFNVVSMLMMSVMDKRKDIAVLQTLGLSQNQVLQLFLVQGALIGILGIALGILLGLTGCYWVADLIAAIESLLGSDFLNTAVYPIDYVPMDLRWSDVVTISVAALCLTLLATIYPAIRASRTVPADELRYE